MNWDNGPFSKDKEPRDTETVASSKSAKGSRGSKRRNFLERVDTASKKSEQKNVAAIKHKNGKAPASQKDTTRKSKKKKQNKKTISSYSKQKWQVWVR